MSARTCGSLGILLVVVVCASCGTNDSPKNATATTRGTSATTAHHATGGDTSGGRHTLTVVVHVPDEMGPSPVPAVAPATPCSVGTEDSNVTVYGPDDVVIASATVPMGILLGPGTTGFASPYQCVSSVSVKVPDEDTYTVTMQDGFSTPKLSAFYLEGDGWVAPVDDANGSGD